MKCTFCKAQEFTSIYKTNHWKVLRCKRCSLVRTSIHKTITYQEYYRDEQYHEEETLFRNIFQKRYDTMSSYFKSPGRVLDIGASTGTMLDIFKSFGWKTYGVEPSESYKIAQNKGHFIYHSPFEEAKLQKNFYDLVIINHTLEHVASPPEVLEKIQKVLKPGGYVYIDVPNFDSISRRIAGQNWKYLLVSEHIHHFEPQTLKMLTKKSKLRVKKVSTWSGIFDVANPLSLIIYKLTHFKKSVFEDIINIPANCIATLLNKGTNLVMIAKK